MDLLYKYSPFLIAFILPLAVVFMITLVKALHSPKTPIDKVLGIDLAFTGALIFFTETLGALNKGIINFEKFLIQNLVFILIFIIALLIVTVINNRTGNNDKGINKKGIAWQYGFAILTLIIVFIFVSNTTPIYSTKSIEGKDLKENEVQINNEK